MSTTKKSGGRGAATRDRITQAATELFLRDGYSATSIDQVAAAAGVTKPTVYSHFGSKEGLLEAMTEAHAAENAVKLTASLQSSGDPKQDLMRFGTLFIQRVLSDEAHCWHRLAISESADFPELGRAVFAAGPARVIKAVQTYIRGETQSGRLTCNDPGLAAEQFLGSLLGVSPIRMMTGQALPSQAKMKRAAQQAVDTFLAAFESTKS